MDNDDFDVIQQELKSKNQKISSSLKDSAIVKGQTLKRRIVLDILIEWNKYTVGAELLQNKFVSLLEDSRALKRENIRLKRSNEKLRNFIWKCLFCLKGKKFIDATKISQLQDNFDSLQELFESSLVSATKNEELIQSPATNKNVECPPHDHHRYLGEAFLGSHSGTTQDELRVVQCCRVGHCEELTRKEVHESKSRNLQGLSSTITRSTNLHDHKFHTRRSTCWSDDRNIDGRFASPLTFKAPVDESLTFDESESSEKERETRGVRDHAHSEKGNPVSHGARIPTSGFPAKRRWPESERWPTGASRKKLKGKPRSLFGERSPGFDRSDAPRARKTSTADAGGTKKLTQTILNIDVFKKLSPFKKENSIISSEKVGCSSVAVADDADVLIGASPRTESPVNVLTITSPKLGCRANKSNHHRGSKISDCIDLDETFVPSWVMNQLEGTKGDGGGVSTPPGAENFRQRPVRDKSPEFESVPYEYKTREVTEKTHAKETLVERSEDRFRSASDDADLNDTPPGYWKPYLTCSLRVPSVGLENEDE